MKTYRNFSDVPVRAAYLGSTYGDGSIDETTADRIDAALEPVCLIDDEGIKHYFSIEEVR
jgi:hypothetical protein